MGTSLYNIVLNAKLEELQQQIPDEFFSRYGKTDHSSKLFSENNENVPVKLYIGYKIWEYVCNKINVDNNEDNSLLSHAK